MRSVDINFLKKRINKNKKTFLKLEKQVENEKDLRKKAELAYDAATFAMSHTTDIFSSPVIENVFLKIAQSHPIALPQNYTPNTVLHVMTEAYITGGHTRCVERWIGQFPEQRHSCVILNQKAKLPENLKKAVEASGGKLTLSDVAESMLKRALDLRKYASQFEYVVLHIHMNDPISLIAFGTEEFKRPIVFFNHADHAFWLGVSISDYVADLSAGRNQLSLEKRGVKRASVLGIPLDGTPLLTIDKKEAREKLGVPEDKKVIFSSGQASKYNPIGHPTFCDIVCDVLNKDENLVFYIAGVKSTQIFWSKLKRMFPKNLILTGTLDYATEYPVYLSASDLVLDSFPVGGGTAMIDAVKAGKPVLTLVRSHADYLSKSNACCHTYEDFLNKSHRILNDKDFAKEIYQNVYEKFSREADPKNWREKCKNILSQLPVHHGIYAFARPLPTYDITSLSLETCCWTEPIDSKLNLKSLIKKIRKYIIQIRLKKQEKTIRILGFYFLRIKKSRIYNGET